MTTSTIAPEVPSAAESLPDLTGHDRCDNGGCNAAAYVRARVSGLDLVFCGHHYSYHESGLLTAGAEIRDERTRLTVTYSDVEATELA